MNVNVTVFIVTAYISLSVLVFKCNCDGRNYYFYTNRGVHGDAITYPDGLELHQFGPNHHHPYQHHNHGWESDTNPNEGRNETSVINGADQEQRQSERKNLSEIPLPFINEINQFNVSDLLLNFVEDYEAEPIIRNRFGEERNAAITPKAAACMPELTTVKIVTTDDPTVLFIPSCTRIERCGGCCTHSLLSCQPKETETVSYQVIKTQYTGGKKLKFVGKEIVLIEKHTKCKCDCKVQPEDCNKLQEYKKSECRCACTNVDEEKKCYKYNETKLWNPEVCACQCREESQCSTGYYFDLNDCKCTPVPMRRRHVLEQNEQKTYRSSQPNVPFVITRTRK